MKSLEARQAERAKRKADELKASKASGYTTDDGKSGEGAGDDEGGGVTVDEGESAKSKKKTKDAPANPFGA